MGLRNNFIVPKTITYINTNNKFHDNAQQSSNPYHSPPKPEVNKTNQCFYSRFLEIPRLGSENSQACVKIPKLIKYGK